MFCQDVAREAALRRWHHGGLWLAVAKYCELGMDDAWWIYSPLILKLLEARDLDPLRLHVLRGSKTACRLPRNRARVVMQPRSPGGAKHLRMRDLGSYLTNCVLHSLRMRSAVKLSSQHLCSSIGRKDQSEPSHPDIEFACSHLSTCS